MRTFAPIENESKKAAISPHICNDTLYRDQKFDQTENLITPALKNELFEHTTDLSHSQPDHHNESLSDKDSDIVHDIDRCFTEANKRRPEHRLTEDRGSHFPEFPKSSVYYIAIQ
ncbi:MAG: hypothetical protein J5838_07605 [Desulfovibrio sp.]|nr:hypothetical protein [Desulfovibrio sp.]